MKASDLRTQSVPELTEELMKLRKEQFNLRMQAATGELSRPDQYGKVRRDIARIKTVIQEIEDAAEAAK